MKVDDVISHFGSASELAKALGVSAPAVSQWISRGAFPAARAIQIEAITDGKFKATDLYVEGE